MKYESLRKYADPSDDQKLLFKRPLWRKAHGFMGFLMCLAILIGTIDAFIFGMIRQHQTDPLAWLLVIVFFILPFVLMAWFCLLMMGPDDITLDFSKCTYFLRRSPLLFPGTICGSFEDIKRISKVNMSDGKTGSNYQVRLEWKPKRQNGILVFAFDSPTASEIGWQLADELDVAFRDN